MATSSSKEAADYTDHGTKAEHCAICRHWAPGATARGAGVCSIVSGAIAPGGWCRYYEDELEAAD
jgi:hypothetical protein